MQQHSLIPWKKASFCSWISLSLSYIQLINTSIQFHSSYSLSHFSMTSLKVAVIHAELAVLKSVSIVPLSDYNSGKTELVAERCKTCFFEEMVTQEVPYNGWEYFDSFLITGDICLPGTCQKMTSSPISLTQLSFSTLEVFVRRFSIWRAQVSFLFLFYAFFHVSYKTKCFKMIPGIRRSIWFKAKANRKVFLPLQLLF